MGTRGLHGFYFRGKYYTVYNQYDSYPESLGLIVFKELINAIKNNQLNEWRNKLIDIVMVSDNDKPNEQQIEHLKPYTDLNVSSKSTNDWYCLLRRCQGSLVNVLESGHCYHSGDPNVDIWIEYCYIVNLDNNSLEFWHRADTPTMLPFDELEKMSETEYLEKLLSILDDEKDPGYEKY